MTSFWDDVPLPIVGLYPRDGGTDHTFRHIQKKYGKPAILYTEFTSVEGVCHGATRLLTDFLFDETQRPIVAQIYGTTPSFFRQTATILCELGFDGIDINMGCPAKTVAHSGAGAALIQTPELALEIIRETKAGVADYFAGKRAKDCADISDEIALEVAHRHTLLPKEYQYQTGQKNSNGEDFLLPVSVKTRVGYNEKVAEWWTKTLLQEEPAVIAMHGRTLKQQYGGLADWEEIAKGASVVATHNQTNNTKIKFLGNGDVTTYEDAIQKVQKYGVDGILIGRSTFGNPFVFVDQNNQPSNEYQIYEIALEHARLYEETYQHGERYSFLPMRKHLGWYVKGIPQASTIRQAVFRTNTSSEVESLFKEYGLLNQSM